MATKIVGAPAARCNTKDTTNQGEYSLNPNDDSSGQEWILDAYRALEPGVSISNGDNGYDAHKFIMHYAIAVALYLVLYLLFSIPQVLFYICPMIIYQKNYLQEFTSKNVRPDGRPFSASRPITVLPSILTRNSYGSAMVTLGGSGKSGATRVIAACTLLVGHPSPSTPNEGDIDVTLTASPLSGPRFDIMGRENGEITAGNYGILNDNEGNQQQQLPGNLSNIVSNIRDNDSTNTTPSPTDTKEIESWIRRTLRSSRYIDPKELGIETGVSAWRIRISIHILNHEGNVWDASLLCACAALADVCLPMVEIDRGNVRIVKDETNEQTSVNGKKNKVQRRKGRSLTLGPVPVPLTIAILPNNSNDNGQNGRSKRILLVDPTHLEEDVAFGNTVTVVCNIKEEIVEFHKKGSGSRLSMDQVTAVGCMGFGRAKELENLVRGGR